MENLKKEPEERQDILQEEVEKWIRKGWQIQSANTYQVILTRKKKIRLITHIIISLLTVGLWLIVPLWQIINRKQHTKVLRVDVFGQVIVD
jgi:hypothetical protein